MKPKYALRNFLALAGSSLLAVSSASAATLFWDGDTVNGGNPAANANGSVGNWDNSLTNWDTFAAGGADSAWTAGNTAVFTVNAAGPATVTLTDNITVGGLTFNGRNNLNGATSNYTIDAAANSRTLSFSSGDNTILFNPSNGATSAIITGQVAGTAANVILRGANPIYAPTLTFNGTSTGGWTGTATIGAGVTMSLAALNQGLSSTSGITLNAGNITLTNTVDGEKALDRVSDTAGIAVNGSSTVTYTNTSAAARNYTETLGAVSLNSGQFNAVLTNNQTGSQTLSLGSLGNNVSGSGLARTTTTSAVTFSAGTTGPNATTNRIAVYGASTTSGWVSGDTSNSIIGAWATTGTTAALQNDYAVYNGGYVAAANTAASAETNWTDATKQYTLSYAAKTATALTATRNIAALKVSSTATTLSSATVVGSPNFVFNAHGFNVNDAVVLDQAANQNIVNFTFGQVYYVASVVDANTITLAATPGGTAINAGTVRANTTITGGLILGSGANLGTTGILNSGTAPIAIGRTSAGGQISLPTAAAGNLFINAGSGSIGIDAPIVNNGGASNHLTVVKTGSSILHLSGNNTFTGGIVVNAGTLRLSGTQSFTGGVTLSGGAFGDSTDGIAAAEINSNSVTVNGNAAMFITSGETLTGAIAINSTGNLRLIGNTATLSGVLSGSGGLTTYSRTSTTVTLTNTANTHTGIISVSNDNNTDITLAVNSLADSASPGAGNIQLGGGAAIGTATFALHSGAVAPLILNNRQFDLEGDMNLGAKLYNNSTQAFTINSNLLASGTSIRTLTLGGTGAGLSTFGGTITNGSLTTLNLTKESTNNTWVLSGANTYNGKTTITAGTLSINSIQNAGSATANALGTPAVGANSIIDIANNSTLRYTGTGHSSDRVVNNTTTNGGNITLDASGASGTFALTGGVTTASSSGTSAVILTGSGLGSQSGVISNGTLTNVAAVTKNGTGTWTLSATNTYTGATTLNAGKLKLDYSTNDTSKLADTTGILALNGGTLELSGGSHTEAVTSTTLNTGTTFITQPTGGATLSMGAITFTAGAIDFAEGSIATTTTGTASTFLSQRATVAGANFAMKDAGNTNIVAYDYVTAGSTGYTGGAMSGSNNYAMQTAGGADTLAATTGGAGNTLKIANTAVGSLAVAANTLTTGAILFAGSANYDITTSGAGRITSTVLHNYGTGGSTLTLGALGIALTQYGTGKTILSAAAGGDYAMNINGGTVQISDNLQIGNNTGAAKVITLNNGTLLASESLSLDADGAGLRARTVTLGAGGGTLGAASTKTLTVSGVISGTLNSLYVGSATNTGTVTLTAANTYTGATTVNGGTLQLGNGGTTGSLSNNSAISVASGATFVVNRSNTVTQGTDFSSSPITGAGGFTQIGNGTTVLTGINTYTGATTVTGGALIVNGNISTSSLTTVQTGATLGGNGSIGALTVQANGTIAPGNSPDGIDVIGAYTQLGIYLADITGNTPGNGTTGYDQVNVTGTVDITGGSLTTLFSGAGYAANDLLFILLNDGTDAITGTYSGFAQGDVAATYGGFDWQISYTGNSTGSTFTGGNDVALMAVAAIPEPRAALLGGLGFLMLLRRRRK